MAQTVLSIDLHCLGCTKRIKTCVMKCEGVDSVELDKDRNYVIVTGTADPEALCARIRKKLKKVAAVVDEDRTPEPDPPTEDGDGDSDHDSD